MKLAAAQAAAATSAKRSQDGLLPFSRPVRIAMHADGAVPAAVLVDATSETGPAENTTGKGECSWLQRQLRPLEPRLITVACGLTASLRLLQSCLRSSCSDT